MTRSTRTENRYAVCIGINKYQPSARLGTLSLAEGDAKAVHDLLGQSGFAPENLCLLLGEDATLDAINSALSTMILDRPGENDLVVFYFAGHSLPLTINEREVQQGGEPRSEVFLTSYDFDREKIKQSPSFRMLHALGMERLRRVFFEGEGSRKRLFIFDSCYSGDFYGPTYRDDQTADPVQGYIRRMLDSHSTGRVALSSCLRIQKAAEDPRLGHGRFTNYLLEGLSGDPEALRRDGCVTVGSLFDYIADKLPSEQRPVLSGVQHDKFELICYPDKAAPIPTQVESEDAKRQEREERLRALLADPSGFSFMRSRLESFVGRENELKDIRELIADMLPTGGYVTITGQPGQGKSSIIARLVEIYQQEYGPGNVAFHFIPLNPGPDHQVSLLRKIMACLILKYNLLDFDVDSGNRTILHDYFPIVLAKLAAQGGQEVIFIDGLDQIKEDATGVRDLSFLPNNPPAGVVFMLGTRPDDTLRPLKLLKPLREYPLPRLSREDFNLILQHRHVHLDSAVADQLYQAIQGNALFLDLLAKDLVAEQGPVPPEALIERLAHNPEHLFSWSIERLKRDRVEWREVIKRALGVLLVAQEPLGVTHIRQILGVEDDRLRDGMERLGGLVIRDQQQRYSLFHLKLAEYLRQDEQRPDKEDYIFTSDDIKDWHNKLAQWCAGHDPIIWQDISNNLAEQQRREYARRHYITHLYHARQWQQLFAVLDKGVYGRAKLRFDPGTRLYAQDLHLGRLAAAQTGGKLEESIAMLPSLWHYTFLRCSLASRADRYPVTTFCLLVLLKRKQEALGLAELLTNPAHKARILAVIADPLAALHERRRDASRDVHEEAENAHLESESVDNARAAEKAEALLAVSLLLQQVEYWVGNEPIWREVELLIRSLPDTSQKARVLTKLALAMKRMGRVHDAEQIEWDIIDEVPPQQAEQMDQAHPENQDSNEAMVEQAMALGKAGRETEARQLLLSLESPWRKIQWLANLGTQAAQIRHRKQIGQIQQDLKGLLHEVAEAELGTEKLAAPTSFFEQEADHEQPIERLIAYAHKLRQGLWRREAEQQFRRVERIIRDISDETRRNDAWLLLVEARGRTKNWREVERLKKEFSPGKNMARFLGLYGVLLLEQAGSKGTAEQILKSIASQAAFDPIVVPVLQDQAWMKLAEEYWKKELWIDAKLAIVQIHNEQRRLETLTLCAKAAIQKQRWQEINTLFENMDTKKKSKMFVRFGKIAVQNGLMEEAEDICDKVEEMIDGDKDDQFFVTA